MKNNETLNDVFGIESVERVHGDVITQDGEVLVHQADSIERNADYDYEATRSNLHSLLNQGQDALIHALEVAKSSEHPRAFEVVGGLMKQLADINGQLLDLSEKRQKLSVKIKKDDPVGPQVTNNNAFFVGSTTELNKMLKNMTGGN